MNKKLKKFFDVAIWVVLALNIPIFGFMLWLTWGTHFNGWPVATIWFLAYCATLYSSQSLVRISEQILKGWDETLEQLGSAYQVIGKMKLEKDALEAIKKDS